MTRFRCYLIIVFYKASRRRPPPRGWRLDFLFYLKICHMSILSPKGFEGIHLTNIILEEKRTCCLLKKKKKKKVQWLPIALIKDSNCLPQTTRSYQTWRVSWAFLPHSFVLIFMVLLTRHSLPAGFLMNPLKLGLCTETFSHHASQVTHPLPLESKHHEKREFSIAPKAISSAVDSYKFSVGWITLKCMYLFTSS